MYGFDNVCSSATKTANHQPVLEKSELFLWRVMGRGSGSISLDPSNGLGRAMRMGDGWWQARERGRSTIPAGESVVVVDWLSAVGGLGGARNGRVLLGSLGETDQGTEHGALPAWLAIVPPLPPCRGLCTGERRPGSSTPWMQQG